MAETLSPKCGVLSPKSSSYCLASNDDQLERATARASRATVLRRKPVDIPFPLSSPRFSSLSSNTCLNRDQIIELFHNCVKLATENKINQKNTWELKLIDHLSDIIKVEAQDNFQPNFQKACCTLEAGVKIYAMRVDAWHADAYRVLGRISRAGLEDEKGASVGGDATSSDKGMARPKKETDRKLSPLSTVESSFEAFNVKKFEVAFSVDPLYHQTSLQFDEGGAKGLLLYNLGVYGGCWILFDSQEMPTKYMSPENDSPKSDLIDIFFARECIEQLMTSMQKEQDISPALRDITKQLDESSFKSRIFEGLESFEDRNAVDKNKEFNVSEETFSSSSVIEDTDLQINGGFSAYNETWYAAHHDNVSVSDGGLNIGDPMMQNSDKEHVPFTSYEHDNDGKLDNVSSLILEALGFSSIQNGVGSYHWKYRNPKGPRSVSTCDNGQDSATKKPKNLKTMELDIEFSSYVDVEMHDIFLPPKHPESLLLTQRKIPPSNRFPEDCHYQPEDLVKLFLVPNITCLGPRRRVLSGSDSWQSTNDCDKALPSWSDQDSVGGCHDDGYNHSDVEQDGMVSQPRQVDKIDVQYDKTSKQVDIQMLKETLWNHMQGSTRTPDMMMRKNAVSFKNVLATFPEDCQAAAFHDISPHLCFICILHLANEYGLTIEGFPNLDDLNIRMPVACQAIG